MAGLEKRGPRPGNCGEFGARGGAMLSGAGGNSGVGTREGTNWDLRLAGTGGGWRGPRVKRGGGGRLMVQTLGPLGLQGQLPPSQPLVV